MEKKISGIDSFNLEKYLPLFIFIFVFIAFIPSLFNGYVNWDDSPILLYNDYVRGISLGNIKWMFTTFYMSHYQPLSWISLALDYDIWKLNPFGYHLTNILLHAFSSALLATLSLVFFKIIKIPYKERIYGAVFAAVFWAVHPLRAESVSWITERRDVLSAALFMLAFYLYVKVLLQEKVQSSETPPDAGNRNVRRLSVKGLLPCFAVYVAACLAKSMAVTLPAVLLLIDFYPFRRIRPDSENKRQIVSDFLSCLAEKAHFFVFAAALSVFYYFVVGKAIDVPYIEAYMPSAAKAVYAYWFYILKTFLPIGLSPVYVTPENGYLLFNSVALIFLGFIAAAAFLMRKKAPGIAVSLLFYAGTLFPVCGLLNGAPVPAADRYSYIPSIGIAVLLGGLLAVFIRNAEKNHKEQLRKAIVFSAFLWLSVITYCGATQQLIWYGSTSVWNRVAKIEPRSAIAYNNLASLVYAKGDKEKAESLMLKAMSLAPEDFNVVLNCGNFYVMAGQTDKALEMYSKVIEMAPDYYDAYIKKAEAERNSGKNEDAAKTYSAAASIRPKYEQAWQGLAAVNMDSGNYPAAESAAMKWLELKPRSTEAQFMIALSIAGQGRYEESAGICRRLLAENPNNENAAAFLKRLENAMPK